MVIKPEPHEQNSQILLPSGAEFLAQGTTFAAAFVNFLSPFF